MGPQGACHGCNPGKKKTRVQEREKERLSVLTTITEEVRACVVRACVRCVGGKGGEGGGSNPPSPLKKKKKNNHYSVFRTYPSSTP